METIIILTALLPIVFLVYYIYHKDKKSPESIGQFVKAFFWNFVYTSVAVHTNMNLNGKYVYRLKI